MKPSYEELKEQLNRSRRLCDAAIAAERVWETAMMQACGEDGPKSVADKFAELESKCAALAAENAGLKNANAEGCKWDGEQWVGISVETPATAAFLAEVRASAVENCAEHLLSNDDIGVDSEYPIIRQFASQLRQGGSV